VWLDSSEIVFVVEDHYPIGGLASLLHKVAKRTKVIGMGWPEDWAGESGDDEKVLEKNALSANAIASRICRIIKHGGIIA
jgi:transketolase C-terminal domain/subunit